MNLDNYLRLLASLKIRDRDSGRPVNFRPNYNQRVFLGKLQEQARDGKPLRAIVCKSRRVGVSSISDGLALCYTLENPGIDARIIAHLDDSVGELFKVPLALVNGLRAIVPNIPDPTANRILIPHEQGASTLSIATAGSTQGGRGAGFHCLHLSEVAFYKSPDALTSLLSTVPYHPNTMVVLESTANGRVGIGQQFFELWNASERKETEFTPIFLSWLDDPVCRRDEREARDAPADDEERDLIKFFKADKQQLAWRRWAINNLCFGYLDRFHQEYPSMASEAFIATSDPAFGGEEMRAARASIATPKQGQLEKESGQYKFVEGRGLLRVWQQPLRDHRYYVGVDSARGTEAGDFASLRVLNGTTNEYVCAYDARISPRSLAKVVNDVARWYNMALCIIELTGNLGLECQTELRDILGYRNLYRWRARDDKVARRGMSNVAGWETNHRTRDMLFTSFRESVREGLKVKDDVVVAQMDFAQRFAAEGFQVIKGHDDSLFAAMLANIACRQYPPPMRLGSKSPMAPTEEQRTGLPVKYQSDLQEQVNKHFREMKRKLEAAKRPQHNIMLEGL